jgi:hypothetical protein
MSTCDQMAYHRDLHAVLLSTTGESRVRWGKSVVCLVYASREGLRIVAMLPCNGGRELRVVEVLNSLLESHCNALHAQGKFTNYGTFEKP